MKFTAPVVLFQTLTTFARAITGNRRVRVEPTSSEGANSTRNLIQVHLPMQYGENIPHQRAVCYSRGDDKQMLCPACRVADDVQFQFFHETGHVALGSHDPIDKADVTRMADHVLKTWGPTWKKWAAAKWQEIRKTPIDPDAGPLQVAAIVHEWMPFTFNVTEDIRVDTKVFDLRPGVRDMSEAITMKILRDGEVFEDERRYWKDQPLERQILLAVSFFAMEYSMEYFSEECQAFIAADPHLASFSERSIACQSAIEAFEVGCELLYYLHTLGMYDPPTEDEDESGDGNESDQNEDQQPHESESGQGGGGAGDDEGSPDDEEGSGGGSGQDQADGDKSGGGNSPKGEDGDDEPDPDAESTAQSGRGDIGNEGDPEPSEDDDGEPADASLPDPGKLQEAMARCLPGVGGHAEAEMMAEAIEMAMVQADFFDESSVEVGGVKFHEYTTSGHNKSSYSAWANESSYGPVTPAPIHRVKPAEATIGAVLTHARRVFSDNVATKHERNKRSGRIVGNSLAKRAPFGDDRMFGKKTRPDARKYYVHVMLDVSGSNLMSGQMDKVRSMGGAIGELLGRLGGVKFGMYAHTAHYDGHTSGYNLDIYPIKYRDEAWGNDTYMKLQSLEGADGNLDGHALEWSRKECDKQPPGTRSIILYETDGQMPATNGPEEKRILIREIDICRQRSYTLLGVGLNTDSPKEYGLETVIVNTQRDIVAVIKALEAKLGRV